MTKTQKNWLYTFLAMFIVPEILWSPVLTLILPLFLGGSYKFRDTVLFSGNISPIITTLVVFVQFLGILFSGILLYKDKGKSLYKLFASLSLFLLSIVTLIALYFQLAIGGSSLAL
jgi:hypothetical protein